MNTNLPEHIKTAADIPAASFYVVCRDTFFTNVSATWIGEQRDNVLVFPCTSYKQADRLAEALRARGDVDRIRINSTKPRPSARWFMQLQDPAVYIAKHERDLAAA